jgi:hypothetical protein
MKSKKLLAGIIIGTMLMSVPVFARGGHGKGYMGGGNSNFTQGSGQLLQRGYGDGTQPKPMDGTGFGAKAGQGKGQMLRDGSCLNQTTK